MSYKHLYEEYLEMAISRGGAVSNITAAVAELNALGITPYVATEAFKAWTGNVDFICGECGDVFEKPPKIVPEPDDEVLCNDCQGWEPRDAT